MLASIFLSTACAPAATPVNVSSLQLHVAEATLRQSPDSFDFAENGHFGDKVQYNSRTPDEFGGSYAVHCRAGKCYGIEVKYPQAGIAPSSAKQILSRLISSLAGAESGHDKQDLEKNDAEQPVEFIYFKNKVRAELTYCKGSRDRVCQIAIWTE